MKEVIKRSFLGLKQYINFLKYRGTLPKNPKHDDIYIVEFPKSGITWLSNLVANIELQVVNKKETVTFYNSHKWVIDIHQARGLDISRVLSRTFIKSHSSYNPYYYFSIYLIRNPFDVMVSYYNFMVDIGYGDGFDVFVKDPKLGIGAWKRNVNSWMHGRVEGNRIHLIRYEDLIEDPMGSMKSLYSNLGAEISENIINEAINLSVKGLMKESEEHYRKYNPNYSMSFIGGSNKKSSKELYTDEVVKYLESQVYDELNRFFPEYVFMKTKLNRN